MKSYAAIAIVFTLSIFTGVTCFAQSALPLENITGPIPPVVGTLPETTINSAISPSTTKAALASALAASGKVSLAVATKILGTVPDNYFKISGPLFNESYELNVGPVILALNPSQSGGWAANGCGLAFTEEATLAFKRQTGSAETANSATNQDIQNVIKALNLLGKRGSPIQINGTKVNLINLTNILND